MPLIILLISLVNRKSIRAEIVIIIWLLYTARKNLSFNRNICHMRCSISRTDFYLYNSCSVVSEQSFGMLFWPHKKLFHILCNHVGLFTSEKESNSQNLLSSIFQLHYRNSQPVKCFRLFLYAGWLIAKHLRATCNVFKPSQKVVSNTHNKNAC